MTRLMVGGAVGTAIAAISAAAIIAVTGSSLIPAFFIGAVLGAVGGAYGVIIASW